MPAWQRGGIYGLEFIGGEVGAYASAWAALYGVYATVHQPNWNVTTAAAATGWYTAGNALFTSTLTWGASRLLDQPGEWKAACVGAAAGALVGAPAFFIVGNYSASHSGSFYAALAAALIPPAVGAVVSLNLWKQNDGY